MKDFTLFPQPADEQFKISISFSKEQLEILGPLFAASDVSIQDFLKSLVMLGASMRIKAIKSKEEK